MSDAPDDPETVQAAIAAVRREGRKAALAYALVDGAIAAVGGNLLAGMAGIEGLATTAGLPAWLADDGAIWFGIVLGVSVLAGEFALRVRRPLVERFEAANPHVREALRTARDVVADGRDTPMARALYADVIEGLGEASSRDLLSTRRLALSVVLLLALSALTVGTTAAGIELRTLDGGPSKGPGTSTTPIGTAGTPAAGDLGSGASVLGEAETVTGGEENLSALVGGSGSGNGSGDRAYDRSGLSAEAPIEAQRAGFAGERELENAELIKEYTLRVRENTSE